MALVALTGQAGIGGVKSEGVLLVVGEAGEPIAQEVQGAQAHQTVSGHLGPAKKYSIYNTIIGHLIIIIYSEKKIENINLFNSDKHF